MDRYPDQVLARQAKFVGALRLTGMPDSFYQQSIDDIKFREWLVKQVKERLGLTYEETKTQKEARELMDSNIWRTVEIGRHKNVKAMIGVLESADCKVSRWARDILNKVIFAQEGLQTLQLVCLTVAELGFPQGATREQIYEAALKRGLYLCPAEVGPALREQYNDQPTGKWLLIAMEPIAGSGGVLSVFFVERDSDGSWLLTHYGHASLGWDPSFCWVFCSSKP